MKVAILHPSYEGSDSPFRDLDPECDPARFLPEFECVNFQIEKSRAVRQVRAVASQGFDVAINLCDGAWDEDRAGAEVVQALERLNIAFTGAGSLFYDPSREAMKMACHSAGVRFPAYVMARSVADTARALQHLRFPMLVKHPHGYSSTGMSRDSRVTEANALEREMARIIRDYGAALIEEFIEGREFTCLVTESRSEDEDAWVFEPVEFCFPDGETFKHFELKWTEFELMRTQPVNDTGLAARIREASALTFAALGGSGYGRCDLRMDEAGEVYVLEINPNCGVFYPEGSFGSADFILQGQHREFLLHLIQCAFRRRDRARKVWRIEYAPGRGFGLFASATIRAGEIVECYEGRPQRLVSNDHAAEHFHGLQRNWFERYAWPVAEGVYGLWSENPDEWRPINHSCDPNCWLSGLDLVARREISAREEITVDYATFCGPGMKSFDCVCGTEGCRRVIRDTDYLLPEVAVRFAGHMSAFVARNASQSR